MSDTSWQLCKTKECGRQCVICRACRRLHPTGCADHATKMFAFGGQYYCDCYYHNDVPQCDMRLQCTQCQKPLPSKGQCAYTNCTDTSTTCAACGPFVASIAPDWCARKPGSAVQFVCPVHAAKQQQEYQCQRCKAINPKGRFTCACCEDRFCDQCDTKLKVDTSPITLYGSGFCTYNENSYCKACSSWHDGKRIKQLTEKDIQDRFRRQGEYRCSTHSRLEYILTKTPYVLCDEYRAPDNTLVRVGELYNAQKRKSDELTDAGYGIAQAYVKEHPEKHVRFDGHHYTWPDAAS